MYVHVCFSYEVNGWSPGQLSSGGSTTNSTAGLCAWIQNRKSTLNKYYCCTCRTHNSTLHVHVHVIYTCIHCTYCVHVYTYMLLYIHTLLTIQNMYLYMYTVYVVYAADIYMYISQSRQLFTCTVWAYGLLWHVHVHVYTFVHSNRCSLPALHTAT